ncbi:MAG: membrane protein insertase YidC [Acidobacteriota bacterium]
MDETRRLFLAALLSLAVFAIWSHFYPSKPVKPPAQQAEATPSATATPGPGASGTPGAPETPAGVPGASGKAPLPAWAGQPVQGSAEQRITLESRDARAVFSSLGAQLVSLQIKDQRSSDGGAVELLRNRIEGPYPYGLVRRSDHRPLPLNQAQFQALVEAGGKAVTFRYRGPEGVAEKRFRFDDQGFLESSIQVVGGNWATIVGPGIRNPTPEEIGSRYGRRLAVYKVGGDVAQLSPQRELEPKTVRRADWLGLEDNYFLAAVIPRTGLERAVLEPVMIESSSRGNRFLPVPNKDEITSEEKKLLREYRIVLEPEGDALALTSYWGDMSYDKLAALPHHLERAVQLGKFAFLARPLLVALHWIHDNVVANYGWAIILLTIVIKIVLLPLTHTNMKSMRKMQELNPKVQAIRDRYKNKLRDKQGKPNLEAQKKMNDEVMAVYKEAGVNPVGGCLPLLLQMPILFAFFSLLTAAVELRNAPWILWIADLSSKDPYYVLPIVMGATQWFQVRMAPQSGDPMQRRIFEMMPIVMTVMFIGVPSGLVLYWLTNNVLTILQQAVYKRLEKRAA